MTVVFLFILIFIFPFFYYIFIIMWEPFSRSTDKWIAVIPLAFALVIWLIIILLTFMFDVKLGFMEAFFIFFLYYIPFAFIVNSPTS